LKIPLCKVEEIPEDGAKKIAFLDREVLALKVEGQPKVIVNICTHLGGSLRREVDRLVCELHYSEFDCRTGQCLKGPAHPESRLLTLPTFVEDGVLTYTANVDSHSFAQLLPHLIQQNRRKE
jgi:nitrite reductase/ring-hydroxylating ferredoxin subunit